MADMMAVMLWIVDKGTALLHLALKHWKITLTVVCLVIIYAHAVNQSRRVSGLIKQIGVLEAQIEAYKDAERARKARAKAVAEDAQVQIKTVTERKDKVHETIKYIYRTDPEAKAWADTPVPDAVARELRDL